MNSTLKVIWQTQAREALRQTAVYIRKHFGLHVRENFRNEVDHVQALLQSNPYMGNEESLLSDCPKKYRSFVINKLNKIVYYIEDDTIHIAAFWDTRREPTQQAQEARDKQGPPPNP